MKESSPTNTPQQNETNPKEVAEVLVGMASRNDLYLTEEDRSLLMSIAQRIKDSQKTNFDITLPVSEKNKERERED
jgi:hypothetical protein